jgi:hypothetical protein
VTTDLVFVPTRENETDDERRMRETINRLCGQMLGSLDSAITLRKAAPAVQRMRHRAKADLDDFAMKAMTALALARSPGD